MLIPEKGPIGNFCQSSAEQKEDKPIKKNSQTALENAISECVIKIKKLTLEPAEKVDMLRASLPKLYDQAGWELKPYLLKHLIQKYA